MENDDPKVATLGVAKRPNAPDHIRLAADGHLRSALDLNAKGQIQCLFMIILMPDGTFAEAITPTVNFREMVGQLEVVKQDWIARYLASLGGRPGPRNGPVEPGKKS